jgi:tRNA G18 (ribose-2'-O)-methylase SpoU
MIIEIDDPDDRRIEAYRNIRERDLVGRNEQFIAEGRVVLEKLVYSEAFAPVSLLIARKRLVGLSDVLRGVSDDVPVYVVGQEVLDTVAGFPLHRGILAIARRTVKQTAAELVENAKPCANILMLSGIANHDNMGGIFRNAAAFGVSAILLDSDCCDPLYRKSIRVSVGGALLVPFAKLASHDEAFCLFARSKFSVIALTPSGSTDISDFVPDQRNALILGAEGPGLPEPLLRRAVTVNIPMAGGFDSLNVATTSGIMLHHLTSRKR